MQDFLLVILWSWGIESRRFNLAGKLFNSHTPGLKGRSSTLKPPKGTLQYLVFSEYRGFFSDLAQLDNPKI
jgi:hypothetical protein